MFGRCIIGWLLAGGVAVLPAAELRLRLQPRWENMALTLPSDWVPATGGQSVRVTRLAALLSDIQLLRPDGSVVRLEGQYGFIDAAAGRLTFDLTAVPPGDYAGLQVVIGLTSEVNHADPGRWPAGHALNPLVNALHWGWQGGYVFLAVEGFWRNGSTAGEESGYSYHLATDAQRMTVRFLSTFTVTQATQIDLALDLARLFRDRKLSLADGSDTTHSGRDDPLAADLAQRAERALFWLEAKPVGPAVAITPSASAGEAGRVTPLAFTVPAGFPQPALPADNPLTAEGVELGHRLFFDRRLSSNGTQSCASCHDPKAAFSDKVALSRGATGAAGVRNAMPLFNLAWHPAFAWDGTKKQIRDQALAAMTNPIEMNADLATVVAELGADSNVQEDIAAAFGTSAVTAGRISLALEQYLLTQISAGSKFDQALRGQAKLTVQEQRGQELFNTEYDPARGKVGADCFHCHGGLLFSDFVARSNGLDRDPADSGAQLATGRPEDHGRFKTPSLRNVALTAPYMHDGRIATLEAVVAHYDHGVQRAANLDPNLAKHPAAGMKLSTDDQAAIVAFLRTLTDARYSRPDGNLSLSSQ